MNYQENFKFRLKKPKIKNVTKSVTGGISKGAQGAMSSAFKLNDELNPINQIVKGTKSMNFLGSNNISIYLYILSSIILLALIVYLVYAFRK